MKKLLLLSTLFTSSFAASASDVASPSPEMVTRRVSVSSVEGLELGDKISDKVASSATLLNAIGAIDLDYIFKTKHIAITGVVIAILASIYIYYKHKDNIINTLSKGITVGLTSVAGVIAAKIGYNFMKSRDAGLRNQIGLAGFLFGATQYGAYLAGKAIFSLVEKRKKDEEAKREHLRKVELFRIKNYL